MAAVLDGRTLAARGFAAGPAARDSLPAADLKRAEALKNAVEELKTLKTKAELARFKAKWKLQAPIQGDQLVRIDVAKVGLKDELQRSILALEGHGLGGSKAAPAVASAMAGWGRTALGAGSLLLLGAAGWQYLNGATPIAPPRVAAAATAAAGEVAGRGQTEPAPAVPSQAAGAAAAPSPAVVAAPAAEPPRQPLPREITVMRKRRDAAAAGVAAEPSDGGGAGAGQAAATPMLSGLKEHEDAVKIGLGVFGVVVLLFLVWRCLPPRDGAAGGAAEAGGGGAGPAAAAPPSGEAEALAALQQAAAALEQPGAMRYEAAAPILSVKAAAASSADATDFGATGSTAENMAARRASEEVFENQPAAGQEWDMKASIRGMSGGVQKGISKFEKR